MRFLLTRRWLLFAAAVAVLGYGCLLLGEWQFHRLQDREERNAYTRENLAMPPVAVQQVLSSNRDLPRSAEWSRVRMSGTYDDGSTVVVRYQTREGEAGVDVVTPLVLDDDSAVLVDRGWMRTENVGAAATNAPAPPAGRVEVVGWVRPDATGSSTTLSQGSVRAISSRALARHVGRPLLRGFVDAERETPAAPDPLVPAELPDLGNGPHFFYGVQWWFFGCLAVFGFGYLAYDEHRKAKSDSGVRRGPAVKVRAERAPEAPAGD